MRNVRHPLNSSDSMTKGDRSSVLLSGSDLASPAAENTKGRSLEVMMNMKPSPLSFRHAPVTLYPNKACQARCITPNETGNPGGHQTAQVHASRQGGFAAARILSVSLALLTLVAVVTGQDYRGRIQGAIRDTSDAVI